MKYAYETLLRLYPNSYRTVFGQEMTAVFELATEELQPRGVLSYARFLCVEFFGLIAGAFAMWTDEYMSRSWRKLPARLVVSLLGGAAVTAFIQGSFYIAIGQHKVTLRSNPEIPRLTSGTMLPLAVAGGTLLFISVFSVAFVWNMRMIGNRSGTMKPIWMPSRAVNSRSKRRATKPARQ